MLPEPAIFPEDYDLLPIGKSIVVGQRLLQALGDLVEIVEDWNQQITASNGETQIESPWSSEMELKSKLQEAFSEWHDLHGENYVRAKTLIPILKDTVIPAASNAKSSHVISMMLGRLLQNLAAEDHHPWKIIVRRRSNRSDYALHYNS